MQEMVAQKGDFTLFALLRCDEPLYGLWDLVVAAPWLKSDTLAATREVVGHLAKSIGTNGERRIQSAELFGMQMDEAIILRAKRPERAKPGRKVAHSTLSASSRRGARKHAVLERD